MTIGICRAAVQGISQLQHGTGLTEKIRCEPMSKHRGRIDMVARDDALGLFGGVPLRLGVADTLVAVRPYHQ